MYHFFLQQPQIDIQPKIPRYLTNTGNVTWNMNVTVIRQLAHIVYERDKVHYINR